MSERIDPEVIEAVAKALRECALRCPDGATAEMYAETAIRVADRERGMKKEYRPTGLEDFYPGARLVRIVSYWRIERDMRAALKFTME